MTVLLSIITFYLLFKITNPEIKNINSSYDAIVILSGNPERAVVGSRLFFEKDAKFIYLSKEASIVKNYISSSDEQRVYEKYIDILLKNNILIENIILFGTDNKSTYDEARFFSKINLNLSLCHRWINLSILKTQSRIPNHPNKRRNKKRN